MSVRARLIWGFSVMKPVFVTLVRRHAFSAQLIVANRTANPTKHSPVLLAVIDFRASAHETLAKAAKALETLAPTHGSALRRVQR